MHIVIRVPYAVKKDNHVKHLGVIFDRKINWRIHKEKLEAKIFKISQYISLSKVWKLSADIKLIRHEALITSIMTFLPCLGIYASIHRLKLRRLQIRTTSSFSTDTPTLDFHMTFDTPCVYDFITRLCRHHTKATQTKSWEEKFPWHWTRRIPTQNT